MNKGDKVILVYSLVSGGVADCDKRLQVGDKLIAVNGVKVVNRSLQFAVQQLTKVQVGHVIMYMYIHVYTAYHVTSV